MPNSTRSRSLSLQSLGSLSDSSFSSAISAPPTAHDTYFFDDGGTFKALLDDGTLYRVHRYLFERHSPAFAAQYLQAEPNADPDGAVRLENVSCLDFDSLLLLMYPSELGACDLSTPQQWISILRLAKRWGFDSLRARALRELDNAAPAAIGTAVDRIMLARELEEPRWLLQALVQLCKAAECPSFADVERLGLRTFYELGRIRENKLKEGAAFEAERAVCASGLVPVDVPGRAEAAGEFGVSPVKVKDGVLNELGNEERSQATDTEDNSTKEGGRKTASSLPPFSPVSVFGHGLAKVSISSTGDRTPSSKGNASSPRATPGSKPTAVEKDGLAAEASAASSPSTTPTSTLSPHAEPFLQGAWRAHWQRKATFQQVRNPESANTSESRPVTMSASSRAGATSGAGMDSPSWRSKCAVVYSEDVDPLALRSMQKDRRAEMFDEGWKLKGSARAKGTWRWK